MSPHGLVAAGISVSTNALADGLGLVQRQV